MEEERILLQVADLGDQTHVKFETKSAEDLFNVAVAIHQLISEHIELALALSAVNKLVNENPEFSEDLENSTVDMTTFNNILKQK